MQAPLPVIYDGDMGGDDAWAVLAMLAHPDRFRVLGITTVFGNVDLNRATRNINELLAFAGHDAIPVFAGKASPLVGPNMLGDDAYGDDGIGGVKLDSPGEVAETEFAPDWIGRTLVASAEKITIFATGPLTNIAAALTTHPAARDKVERVVLMGGGLNPGPRPDIPGRSGNITVHAEFNFFQDPYAVNAMSATGVPLTVLTMDANQHIDLDPVQRERFRSIEPARLGQALVAMLDPVAALDMPKFGARGPFIHDPNVIVQALNPGCYEGQRGFIAAEQDTDAPGVDFVQQRRGKMIFNAAADGNAEVVLRMTDPATVLAILHDSFTRIGRRMIERDRAVASRAEPLPGLS